MCGRFALKESPKVIAEHFQLTGDVSLSTIVANILPVRQFGWIRIYRNNVALTFSL